MWIFGQDWASARCAVCRVTDNPYTGRVGMWAIRRHREQYLDLCPDHAHLEGEALERALNEAAVARVNARLGLKENLAKGGPEGERP